MGWAVRLEGRTGPAGILLLIDDKNEAESIAQEIRRRGTRIVVSPYRSTELVRPGLPVQAAGPSGAA
jgi:hypothetical protein